MSILKNELVRKYFCFHEGCPLECRLEHREVVSARVIAAMEAEIKKGELYLVMDPKGSLWTETAVDNFQLGFHPAFIRLPDRFQAKECKCGSYQTECPACGKQHVFVPDFDQKPIVSRPNPIEAEDLKNRTIDWIERAKENKLVEEKIAELSKKWNLVYDGIEMLRALVRLARGGK